MEKELHHQTATFEQIRATLREVSESQKDTDRQMRETDRRMKKLDKAVHHPVGGADREPGGGRPGRLAAKTGYFRKAHNDTLQWRA